MRIYNAPLTDPQKKYLILQTETLFCSTLLSSFFSRTSADPAQLARLPYGRLREDQLLQYAFLVFFQVMLSSPLKPLLQIGFTKAIHNKIQDLHTFDFISWKHLEWLDIFFSLKLFPPLASNAVGLPGSPHHSDHPFPMPLFDFRLFVIFSIIQFFWKSKPSHHFALLSQAITLMISPWWRSLSPDSYYLSDLYQEVPQLFRLPRPQAGYSSIMTSPLIIFSLCE